MNLNTSLLCPALLTAALISFTGCSLIHEDISECPAELRITFKYDYNIKFADAFAHEVKSVNVWAFDRDGNFVWSGSAAGEKLSQPGFYLETPLGEGAYDFVSWCGLEGNNDFDLGTYTPANKQELEMKLKTIETDGLNVSSSHLPGLYHANVNRDVFIANPTAPTIHTVEMPLMKDTKDIRVMLQHLDGSPIDNRDFSVTITDANSWLEWNNDITPGCPTVTYRPWNIKYGQTTRPDDSRATITTVSSLMFELATSRLMTDANAILTVHRNWDDQDIIQIPLIDYLLLVKGHYGDISDQEYLDRQDDYSMIFFIDKDSNWYTAGGIFINSWAVVPPQNDQM